MIIVEGTDRVGKTTVCRVLKDMLPHWSYRHHGVPKGSAFQFHARFVADSRSEVIVDRLHWSEFAYGHTYRGICDYSDHEWDMLELGLLAHPTHIILMHDVAESIATRYEGEPFAIEKLQTLQHAFNQAAKISNIPCSDHTLPQLVKEDGKPTPRLIQIVDAYSSTRGLSLPPSMSYGRRSPSALFIGDGRDLDLTKSDLTFPFCEEDESGFFWATMGESCMPLEQYHFTSCRHFPWRDSQYHNRPFDKYISELRPQCIVTLGNLASQLVDSLPPTWRIMRTWHPRTVKQYRYDDRHDWMHSIKQFISGVTAQKWAPAPREGDIL